MKIAYLSVSCEVNSGTKNLPDTAIARYVSHLLAPVKELYHGDDSITLVTNKSSQVNLQQQGIAVQKVFNKNLFIGWKILNHFRKHKFDVIHFQHEFFIYGGIPQSFLITLALLLLRKPKKIITAHHVLDISGLDKNMVAENNYAYPVPLVKAGLLISYLMMVLAADKVIVHEEEHKRILVKELKRFIKNIDSRIEVVPHGIGQKNKIPRQEARQKLQLKSKYYVIFFGYVARHKGLHLLLRAVKKLQDAGQDVSIIVAGGYHPKLRKDDAYQAYYNELFAYGKTIKNIVWKGFTEDQELPLIFSAADLAVFPYTTRNATSGSVTDAIAYSVPFIVSEKFNTIKDFQGLLFETNEQSIAEKIGIMLKGGEVSKRNLAEFQKKYDWKKIAATLKNLYLNLLK